MRNSSRFIMLTLTLILAWSTSLGVPLGTLAQKGASGTPAAPVAPAPAQEAPVKPTVNRPPTAAPQPTATPQPTPLPELDLDKVEPSRLSTHLGGTLSLFGGGFTPDTLVRLVDYGLLETTYVSGTMLKASVPTNVRPKEYDVEVVREDGAEDRKKDALRIDPEPVIPIATPRPDPTLQPTTVPGRPQLVIEAFSTEPAELEPDVPFTVTLSLANRGNRTANNVLLSLSNSTAVLPVGGSNATTVPPIGIGQSVTASLRLAFTEATTKTVTSDHLPVSVDIEYTDYLGGNYSAQQIVSVRLKPEAADAGSRAPKVIVNTYVTDPPALSPGDAFTLTLEVINVGKGDTRRLTLTMGGDDGAGLKPFALLGTGNVRYVSTIPPEATLELSQALMVDGGADSGVYNLPIVLTYEGSDEDVYEETQVLNLLVRRQPQLRIAFYRSVMGGMVGQPLELPIEVVNIGRKLVNINVVELVSDGMAITMTGANYIGPLDGGLSGSLDATGIPSRPGEVGVDVRVHYLDDFEQPQVYTATLPTEVQEMPAMPTPAAEGQEPGEPSVGRAPLGLRIIRGFLGFGS
jgi:hypothetical protein